MFDDTTDQDKQQLREVLDLRDRCICRHDASDHVPDHGPGYCRVQDCLCEGFLEDV